MSSTDNNIESYLSSIADRILNYIATYLKLTAEQIDFIIKLKYVFILSFFLTISLSIFGVYKIFNPSNKIKMNISSMQLKTKDINKLFTGFFILPVIDKKYGYVGTAKIGHGVDTIKKIVSDDIKNETQKAVVGYCVRKFEVAIGYEDVSSLLLNSEIINNACHNNTNKLPNPQILAVNIINTEGKGDYTGSDMCYRWDYDLEERNKVIIDRMKDAEIYESINQRGKETLKTFASIFCE